MKTSFYCCKSAIILTLFLSFAVANAYEVSILDVSVNDYTFLPGTSIEIDYEVHYICKVLGPRGCDFTLRAYASSDSTITDSDFYLGSKTRNVNTGSGSLSGTITGYFPMDIPQGGYYIGVTSYSDSDYDPNPVTVEAALFPDLELTYIGIRDSYSIIPGGWGSVNITVENIGLFESKEYVVYFYVSEDSTITDDDYEAGHSRFDSLAPGQDINVDKVFHLPDDIPCGDYYIGGIIDCSYDSNLGNNSSCGDSFSVVEPIDISVQNVSVNPENCIPGGSINVTVTVENIERMSSDGYTVYYYASTNYTTTYLLGSLERSGLLPGETETFDHLCQLPQDIPVGQYYIGVKLTCDNDTDEDNNEGWSNFITVDPSSNLVVQSVNATDGIYKPGDNIMVNVVIENIGEQTPGGCNIDFYASTDRYTSVNDYEIKNVSRSGLTPGESHSFNTTCQFPFDIPEGDYHIGVIVTWSYDGGSGNTDRSSDRTVWVGPPVDLAVQSVNATNGVYQPGDEIVVYSLIENIGEQTSEDYTVDYYASTDANIATSDYHISYVNRSGLAAGEQHSYETTCQFPFNIPAGNYYIGIIVTYPKDYDPADNVGDDNTTVELVHPAGYVCGQMKYQDRWSRKHPIRYALVKIYEDDNNNNPLDDRVIGQTYTDHNGTYGVIVLNDNQSGQDIYIKVFTDSNDYPGITSKICDVKDDIFGETYSLESPLYLHPQDSSVIVDMTAPNSGGAFMVCDSVIEGFHKAKTFFDVNLPEITTYWPSSEDSSYYVSSVGLFIAQEDRGDRDVIMHEYGHYIAETYGFAQGSVGENSIHYWNLDLRYNPDNRTDEEAMNLAFREAWASLFSIATQRGDSWYLNSGDTRYQDVDEGSGETLEVDLEEDTDSHNSPGQYFENMNCCALWDIFDDHNDGEDNNDTLSDTSLSKIWTISRDYQPDDIIDFWNSWFQSYDYASEITRIFRDHEMSFPKPEQTNPTP
jgi:hypothetical protein